MRIVSAFFVVVHANTPYWHLFFKMQKQMSNMLKQFSITSKCCHILYKKGTLRTGMSFFLSFLSPLVEQNHLHYDWYLIHNFLLAEWQLSIKYCYWSRKQSYKYTSRWPWLMATLQTLCSETDNFRSATLTTLEGTLPSHSPAVRSMNIHCMICAYVFCEGILNCFSFYKSKRLVNLKLVYCKTL